MRRILIPLTLLMMAACSSGDDVDTTVAESPDTAPATVEADEADNGSGENAATVPDDEPSTTTATTTAATVADSTTTTTTTTIAEVAPVEPLINAAQLIPTVTPEVVDMLRPVLEWDPIDGADSYSVVVLDDAGEPYWAWSGPESEITLGGAPSSDFGVGPIIGVDYSWSVAAFDADGVFLAVSGQVPISTE